MAFERKYTWGEIKRFLIKELKKTKHIIDNHLIDVPDPNVSVTNNCEPIQVEMIVRGYISGVTNTSIWGSYEKGERVIYGLKFPDCLKKNQNLG